MLDYSERLKEPGFNVVESISGRVVLNLAFEYKSLGHKELSLLNATDRKLLAECWGEPQSHTTLYALHEGVWKKYEDKILAKRKKERSSWLADLD